MDVVHLWLATYARVGLVLALGFVLGHPMMRALRVEVRHALAIPLTVGAGLGVLTLSISVLSWLHVFTPLAIGVLGAAAAALALGLLMRQRDRSVTSLRGWWASARSSPMLLVALLAMAAFFLLSVPTLYPATAFDGTSYHLPLARDLVVHHGFYDDPFVRFSFFPQADESLMAVTLMMTPNTTTAQGLQLALLGLAVWVAVVFVKEHTGSARAGLLTGIILVGSPILLFTATTPYIEPWLVFNCTAAFVAAALAVRGRTSHTLGLWALTGVFAGAAIAGKYTAIIFVVSIVGSLLIVSRPARTWSRALPVVVGTAALFAAPWYVRTAALTGDPVYPFLASLFHAKGPWTSAEIQDAQASVRGTVTPGVVPILQQDLRYLLGRTPSEVPGGMPFLTPFLGAGVLGLLSRRLRSDVVFMSAVLGGIIGLVAWVLLTADQRYVLPLVGPLSIAAALALDRGLHAFAGAWGIRAAADVVLVGLVLWAPAAYTADLLRTWPPPTSAAEVKAYIDAAMPCSLGIDYLNARFGDRYRAYQVECQKSSFYALGTYMGEWFGIAAYRRVLGRDLNASPAVLARRLDSLEARFLILPDNAPISAADLVGAGLFRVAFDSPATVVLERVGPPAG